MKRISLTLVLTLLASVILTGCLLAADPIPGRKYYQWPTADLKDNSRILVFDSNSGSRNVTGAGLKSQLFTSPVFTFNGSFPVATITSADGGTTGALDFTAMNGKVSASNNLDLITYGNLNLSADSCSIQGQSSVYANAPLVSLIGSSTVSLMAPTLLMNSGHIILNTGISNYASNAAAIAAGLTVGMLYRNGDALMIVH